jgi:hypothetical protein
VGYKVTGGGFETPDNTEPSTIKNKPINNGWKVAVGQKVNALTFLMVYAQCGKLVNYEH